VIVVDPSECVCGLEGNHRLLHSLVIAVVESKVSAGASVIHKVELGKDTFGFVGLMTDRIISRTGGSIEEAINVLLVQSCFDEVITHTASSVEEGVIVEETGELYQATTVGWIGIGVGANG